MTDEVEVADEEVVEATPEPLPEHEVLRSLVESFEAATWHVSRGQDVVDLTAEDWVPFAEAAKAAGFEMCVDVTAVDYLGVRDIRFDVVANLLSVEHGIRVRMLLPTDFDPDEPTVVPSLTGVWPGANFFEREAYDMFGIEFEGHPDMSRILMPDDWVGYPLRKDFGVGSVPIQFKDAHKAT
jgi:NADH/F420H2 dehydrogenase subunit C